MKRIIVIAAIAALPLTGDQKDLSEQPVPPAVLDRPTETEVIVPAGTRVPLVMINSISSKHSRSGDPVYLESVYPVVVEGRILIPAGTRVSGRVMLSKRPGRIKGRGKLGVRMEQMILPNGVIRSLMGRPEAVDGRSPDNIDRESGTVSSPGQKGEDARDIAMTTATGASFGTLVGAIGGDAAKGLGVGSVGGLAAGVATVLLTRGPDAMLDRGTHVEMLLERELQFTAEELRFDNPVARQPGRIGGGPDPARNNRNRGRRGHIGRFPL